MKKGLFALILPLLSTLCAEEPFAHSHDSYLQYSLHGTLQRPVAIKRMGANQFEAWRSSMVANAETPVYIHETEKVIILLKGKLHATLGNKEIDFQAPATLVCPAYVPHQLKNPGDEPTDHILIFGSGSKIYSAAGEELWFPWR